MGLIKKDGYIIKGVELKPAYVKIIFLEATTSPDKTNTMNIIFGISTEREHLDDGDVLSSINYTCSYDRATDDLFNQAYTKAKETIFEGWEDDIVTTEEEESAE